MGVPDSRVRTLRNAATLLEDVGCDDFVNPPTADAMQKAAVELRALAADAVEGDRPGLDIPFRRDEPDREMVRELGDKPRHDDGRPRPLDPLLDKGCKCAECSDARSGSIGERAILTLQEDVDALAEDKRELEARVVELEASREDRRTRLARHVERASAQVRSHPAYRPELDNPSLVPALEAEVDRLEARVVKLTAALRPFVEAYERVEWAWAPDDVPLAAFEDARVALAAVGEGDGPRCETSAHDAIVEAYRQSGSRLPEQES